MFNAPGKGIVAGDLPFIIHLFVKNIAIAVIAAYGQITKLHTGATTYIATTVARFKKPFAAGYFITIRIVGNY